MNRLVLTAAITGAELSKKDNPALPITAQEQAQQAADCVRAGASIIHLHVRDELGQPSQEVSHFKAAVDAIAAECDSNGLERPVIQFSTGGAVGEPMEKRIAPLTLRPEMASFNLGTMNFGQQVFTNTRPDMRRLAKAFAKYRVIPEFEVYDLGHIDELHALIREGLVCAPFHVQFVLGVPGGAYPYAGNDQADDSRLKFLVRQLPDNASWGVAGIGRFERPLAIQAMKLGGNVRVGLEDNIYLSKGVLAPSNAALVDDIVGLTSQHGRVVTTISQTRALLAATQ